MSRRNTPGFGPPPASWCWATLAAAAASQLWLDLAGWVGWLRGRYPLAERLPACWWRHPEVVEELTALWLAWQRAYLDPKAELGGPIDFHSRLLPGCVGRIREWGVHCDAEHHDRPPFVYDDREVDDPDAFREHVGVVGVPEQASRTSTRTDRLTAAQVRDLSAAGAAHRLGEQEDAALDYDGSLWIAAGEVYVRVTDEDFASSLRAGPGRSTAGDPGVGDEDGPP
jgi:Domain of unknown function (DUF4913)